MFTLSVAAVSFNIPRQPCNIRKSLGKISFNIEAEEKYVMIEFLKKPKE